MHPGVWLGGAPAYLFFAVQRMQLDYSNCLGHCSALQVVGYTKDSQLVFVQGILDFWCLYRANRNQFQRLRVNPQPSLLQLCEDVLGKSSSNSSTQRDTISFIVFLLQSGWKGLCRSPIRRFAKLILHSFVCCDISGNGLRDRPLELFVSSFSRACCRLFNLNVWTLGHALCPPSSPFVQRIRCWVRPAPPEGIAIPLSRLKAPTNTTNH